MLGNPRESPQGVKRKRPSQALHVSRYEMACSPGSNFDCNLPHWIERSIDNAIVLLVLALGAICEWKDQPLPGPVKVPFSDHTLTICGLQNVLKNIDVILGLAYYAYATNILGNL